jgi:imidazole glycerol-phosphate synthase subunit HisH
MNRVRMALVDPGSANLRSVSNALAYLGIEHVPVTAPDVLEECTHLLLPGVGSFHTAMRRLHDAGLVAAVRAFAQSGRPVLGLCLGMQLLAAEGAEGEPAPGLGLLPGRVDRLRAPTVPHVGWNSVHWTVPHPLWAGIRNDADYYFVHSYHLVTDAPLVLGTSDWGHTFAAAVGHGNVAGFQFHPEKSQLNGLALLERFGRWDGRC